MSEITHITGYTHTGRPEGTALHEAIVATGLPCGEVVVEVTRYDDEGFGPSSTWEINVFVSRRWWGSTRFTTDGHGPVSIAEVLVNFRESNNPEVVERRRKYWQDWYGPEAESAAADSDGDRDPDGPEVESREEWLARGGDDWLPDDSWMTTPEAQAAAEHAAIVAHGLARAEAAKWRRWRKEGAGGPCQGWFLAEEKRARRAARAYERDRRRSSRWGLSCDGVEVANG